ncbi:MAG: DUF615 domain-containing protein [Myxococcales bacterium]|jgi:ribosomal 50S subunit-associated protein YjgA (DUF615 family)|nr:DUF615 domain-containing protein [Myxococcales bacterium]
MTGRDDEGESERQVARRARREAGLDSARLANALMKLPATSLAKLGLDEDLRTELERARAVTSMIARRRAERSVAGALRRVDLVELATRMENVRVTGINDPQRLHQAERWRTRLLDEANAPEEFCASFPACDHPELLRLIDAARRERSTGRPPGAARALFRHVAALMDDAQQAARED